jgi:protein involved in temperature-dependent protein secretion
VRALGLALLLFAALPSAASTPDEGSLQEHVRRNPYDYAARRDLIMAQSKSGDLAAAYHHAAWMAWLGPRECVESAEGSAFLRSRANRDRVRRESASDVATVAAAVEARQLLLGTCLNGAIAQQATRLRRELFDHAERAQATAAGASTNDPVVRMALAHLALALDDALTFEAAASAKRARLGVLRAAASRAQAAASMLPEAPGPYRLLAVVRSRMAELDNDPRLWDLAISEAERARQLDPSDSHLAQLLWTLHLRAGHWEEAKLWEQRVAAAAGACQSE